MREIIYLISWGQVAYELVIKKTIAMIFAQIVRLGNECDAK